MSTAFIMTLSIGSFFNLHITHLMSIINISNTYFSNIVSIKFNNNLRKMLKNGN